MASFDLTGKTALVTGASRGLGQTFSRALAQAGADLVVTSRTLASLDAFCAEIRAMGRRITPVVLDVRDHASIRACSEAAALRHSREQRGMQRAQAGGRYHVGR